jgi:hypothetical protein
MSCVTTTPVGHSRSAIAIGIAEWTPNAGPRSCTLATTPRARRSADQHRLAAQAGIVALLDGGEERVEIDVEDRARIATWARARRSPPALAAPPA